LVPKEHPIWRVKAMPDAVKNRAREFFQRLVCQTRQARLLVSSQHFTVHGTLIESWASLKNLQLRDEQKLK
jgi:hypothetical protein